LGVILPFCSSCGADNGSSVKFCSECGKPVVAVAQTEEVITGLPTAPKKSIFKNKGVIFGGGGFLLVLLIAVGIVIATPFKIDPLTAEDRLLTTADFSFDAEVPSDTNPLNEGKYPIFNAGDDCSADLDGADLLASDGEILAFTEINDTISPTTLAYFDETIVEFTSEAKANEFLSLARQGFEDTGCEYDNTTTESRFTVSASGGKSVQDVLGVGGSNSIFFSQDSVYDSLSSGYDLSWQRNVAVIARGNYVIFVVGTVDLDDDSAASESEMYDYMRMAIKKIFG
jgi:hypothetical protein